APNQITAGMPNNYLPTGDLAYPRTTSFTKINSAPTESTQIFGKYSIEPFTIDDPQGLGAAGGPSIDGGQPGAAAGRIQNVGLGVSHIISSSMVIDADFGYTRQRTGAQSLIDIAAGDFGQTLGIPGTNGQGQNYVGQPVFAFGAVQTSGASTSFTSLGNTSGANPFLFRDNQFTGDVNFSWNIRRHATKYGFTYYHFLLNHFQPSSGGAILNPRGGFAFQGGMTCTSTSTSDCGLSTYNALADFLLGLPNQAGTASNAVAKTTQFANPNSLRWSVYAAYAQDQWAITPKLTLNYGVRYEFYPMAYRNHGGAGILDPTLPQSANIMIGGIDGNPQNAGIDVGHGFFAPRLGVAYRIDDKTVIRAGAGVTSDPDSFRFLRDSYPATLIASYNSPAVGQISVDPANNSAPMPLSYGIPAAVAPAIVNGFTSLPVTAGTATVKKNFNRGYIESWNLFFQHDMGLNMVANIGYVGTHQVRQPAQTGYLNAAPLASGSTICMANGQFNPSSPYYNGTLGSNPCSFAANTLINIGYPCPPSSKGRSLGACYNTGGIGVVEPLFSATYNALQAQLTRYAGRNSSFGLVYTWSHAFAYAENGAGSGSSGVPWNYPAYYKFNRATANYDRTNNLQFWGIYSLPFGHGQKWANRGLADTILGGFQLNGSLSHISGTPFTVNANSNPGFAPGAPLYADLVANYRQIGGHLGGKAWFNPSAFANPIQPTYTATMTPDQIAMPVFGNTGRNQFRGPGQTVINASVFRGFHVWRESEFQIRFEAFNALNHPQLGNPNTTVPSPASIAAGNFGNFGVITGGYGATRTLQFSGRFNF
ncbi:MAG: TonB-dependent receptor, partial [Acidobacteriaceae bacterium]|nr:TonB-dependent receptor [Acidobacteriaceae bacterium]